ncbi:MAG: phosphoenolpyruvate--protein phosphotransferase [Solibacillus sp.]
MLLLKGELAVAIYKGLGASEGLAIGNSFHYNVVEPDVSQRFVKDFGLEIKRFHDALESAEVEITALMNTIQKNLGEHEAEIFAAHLLILEDTELINPIIDLIKEQKVNAEYAVHTVATSIIMMFNQMDDEYLTERALDIYDVKRRILMHLTGDALVDLTAIHEPTVIIAHDLTPSDTATLNPQYIKAIITEVGGKTSHTAIIAKSLGIPAIVSIENALQVIPHQATLIIDGTGGTCIVNPSSSQIEETEMLIEQGLEEKQLEKQFLHLQTKTADGHHVELAANIASPQEANLAHEKGAEGIGLFRTEFLYMGTEQLPTEEEQFESYKKVIESMGDRPVVVRTFDIGGDKELPYLKFPYERNPFLGYRAIRISLDRPDIFTVQLRALLRASVYGNLHIMFPMIATVEELRQAKQHIIEEKIKLQNEGYRVADQLSIGMMIEIPSVALIADMLVKEVDFFSIGTNDLIQYTLAADRMNDKVSYLYQPFHPAILRLIKQVIDATKDTDVWVGVCGEMGSDPVAAALLVGLGIDELSMSPSSILKTRKFLSHFTLQQLQKIAQNSLSFGSSEEIIEFVHSSLKLTRTRDM